MIQWDDSACQDMKRRALDAHAARQRRYRQRQSRENRVIAIIAALIALYFGGHLIHAIVLGWLP